MLLKVAKESVKQIICDVGHHANVKAKLRELLTSEIVSVGEMSHDGLPTERSIDDQGTMLSFQMVPLSLLTTNFPS
jgi:hypothetical protein